MKNIIGLFLIVFISCKSGSQVDVSPTPQFNIETIDARVTKIDSVKSYNLIYIQNETSFYKVVSKKSSQVMNGLRIEKDQVYSFQIEPITDRQKNAQANDRFTPINYLDISDCRKFEGIEICTESSYELAKAKNVKGLYLIK